MLDFILDAENGWYMYGAVSLGSQSVCSMVGGTVKQLANIWADFDSFKALSSPNDVIFILSKYSKIIK